MSLPDSTPSRDGGIQGAKVLSIPSTGNPAEKGADMSAEIGDMAPDFTLTSGDNEKINLGQYRGKKHVVLSFHIFNFTSG